MKREHTIQELRKSGYRVWVTHRDWVGTDRELVNVDRLSRDGNPCVTQIDVTTPNGEESTGFAFRVMGDFYDRKHGNRIALNRAMSKL